YFVDTPETDRVVLLALALILGGAVGNLVDRVLSGSVTDFIDVYVALYRLPTFNAADTAIMGGPLLIAGNSLRRRRPGTAGA
ncbi:MAG: signal peptidase II, partial [Thermoanaerobaculia bacterium]|nr:signal peptidase II [Thermoanaerobaculia bacterium]